MAKNKRTHRKFNFGDVVWAHRRGVWWPAVITEKTFKDLKTQPLAVVEFLGIKSFKMVKRRRHMKPFHCNDSIAFIRGGRRNSAEEDDEEWEEFKVAIEEARWLCGQQQKNQETAQETSHSSSDADDCDDLTSTAVGPSGHSADVSGGGLAAARTAEQNGQYFSMRGPPESPTPSESNGQSFSVTESPESPTPSEFTTGNEIGDNPIKSISDDNGSSQSYKMRSRTDFIRKSLNVSTPGSIQSKNGSFVKYAMRSQTDSSPRQILDVGIHMEMPTAVNGSSSPVDHSQQHEETNTEGHTNTFESIPDQSRPCQTHMDVQTDSNSLLDRGSSDGIQINMQYVASGPSSSAAHTSQGGIDTEEHHTNQTRLYTSWSISDQHRLSKTYDETNLRDEQSRSSNVGIHRGLQSFASTSSAFVPFSRDRPLSYITPSTQSEKPPSPECREAIEFPSYEQINHGLGYPGSTYSKIENDLKLKIPNQQDALKFIQTTGYTSPVLEASINCETVSRDGVKVAPYTGVQSSHSSESINRLIIGNPPFDQVIDPRHNNPLSMNATDSTTPLQFSEFPELQIFPVHQSKCQPTGQVEELAGVPKRKVSTDTAHVEPQHFSFLNQKKQKMDKTGTTQSISQPGPSGVKSMLEILLTEDTHVQEPKVAVRPTSSPHDRKPHDLQGIDLRTPADSMFLMNGISERRCIPRLTEHPYRLTARSEDSSLFRIHQSMRTSGLVNRKQPSLSNQQCLSVEPNQYGQSGFAVPAPPNSVQHINTYRTIDSMRAMELPGSSRNDITSQADMFQQQYNPVPQMSEPTGSMETMPYNIPPTAIMLEEVQIKYLVTYR